MTGQTDREKALKAAAEAGWNACRRQVYLLSEDYVERTYELKRPATEEGGFYRGQYDVAKSFAKAFSAFEAVDCDYFKQIDFASIASPTLPGKAEAEGVFSADEVEQIVAASLRAAQSSPVHHVLVGEPVIIRLPWHKEPNGDFWRAAVIGHVYEVHDDEMADYKKRQCQYDFEARIRSALVLSATPEPYRAPVGAKRAIVDELVKARSDFMINDFEIAESILAALTAVDKENHHEG